MLSPACTSSPMTVSTGMPPRSRASAARTRPSIVNSGRNATATRKTARRPPTPERGGPAECGRMAVREDVRHDARAEDPVDHEVRRRGREEAVHERRQDLLRHELGRPAAEVHERDGREERSIPRASPRSRRAAITSGALTRAPLDRQRRLVRAPAAEVGDQRPQVGDVQRRDHRVNDAAPDVQVVGVVRRHLDGERRRRIHECDGRPRGVAGDEVRADRDHQRQEEPSRHHDRRAHPTGRRTHGRGCCNR